MKGFEAGQIEGAPMRRRPRRLSQLFAQLSRDANGRVTLGSIRDALGDRSFAALLVLFAAFNLLPLPPGASAILGLPLLIVSAQMMYGSKRAWLPRFVAEKSLPAEQFRSIMERVVPRLVRLEIHHSALLAVLASARRPHHRHDRISAGGRRDLAHSAR